MAKFKPAFKLTNIIEGIYSNDGTDPETYRGINRKAWPKAKVWKYIDAYKAHWSFPHNIDHAQLDPYVVEFFEVNFWRKIKGDKLTNQHQANLLYDVAVNTGVWYASISLQRALNCHNRAQRDFKNLRVDGKVGKRTLKAAAKLYRKRGLMGELTLMVYFYGMVINYWYEISQNNDERLELYINGWGKRAVRNIYLISSDYINQGYKI